MTWLRFVTRRTDSLQIPLFVPFIGCFCGALVYDVFIYTGDSPINNGKWSPRRLRDSMLAKLGKKDKKRQTDEENLEVECGEEGSKRRSSSELRRGDTDSQDSRSDISRRRDRSPGVQRDDWAQQNDPGPSEVPEEYRTAKPGFKGPRWDAPSKAFIEQQKRKHRPVHGTEAQKTAYENMMKENGKDPNHDGIKDEKETGYDQPNGERHRERFDQNGNETRRTNPILSN